MGLGFFVLQGRASQILRQTPGRVELSIPSVVRTLGKSIDALPFLRSKFDPTAWMICRLVTMARG